MKSKDKWPVVFQITLITESLRNESLTTYLVVGIMNYKQVDTMAELINLHANFQVDEDKYVIAVLLTQDQLKALYVKFEPLSRSWRGQYQSLTKAFVKAYQEVML